MITSFRRKFFHRPWWGPIAIIRHLFQHSNPEKRYDNILQKKTQKYLPLFVGTDSRLGWGFRLGDRADFQVLVELGPQQYTQPLANQGDNANNKRNTIDSLSDTLYAQRQEEKRQKLEREQQKQEVIFSNPVFVIFFCQLLLF